MAKPEWGTKRTCPACGAKFYDFDKEDPLTCPACGNEFTPELVLKPRRGRPDEEAEKKPAENEEADASEDDDDLLDIDDNDDDDTLVSLDDADDDAGADVGVDIATDDDEEN